MSSQEPGARSREPRGDRRAFALYPGRWLVLGALAICVFVLGVAQAAAVTVRSSLSRGLTVVGDPVDFRITVTGARSVTGVGEAEVDGLTIRHVGTEESTIFQPRNGVLVRERTILLTYRVEPQKNGKFKIPAVTITADGKAYQTEPQELTVQASNMDGDDMQSLAFAEFVLPKKTAFLGEAIPIELRFYVDGRLRWESTTMPQLDGEGFTKVKFPEPARDQAQRNGRLFRVMIFKTVVTPTQAGKLTLGPTEIQYTARVPRAGRASPRSSFDLLDLDGIYNDPNYSSVQQLKGKAPAVELTVKTLPVPGRPADFSGAIGNFRFTAEGSPKLVKIDNPLTMKLRVTGRGNFDRISPPVLADPEGWRTYPPSNEFKGSDELGYSGMKTFEMAVVPETNKTATPVFALSYFDPATEKYVTLRSEPEALIVQGTPTMAAVKPAVEAGESPAPAAPVAPKPTDILGPLYELGSPGNYTPLYARPDFWYAQTAMGVTLLAFLAMRIRRGPDAKARAAAQLRRDKATALARLRDGEIGPVEFFETAARVAQIETALTTGQNAGSVDAAAVHAAGPLSAEAAAVIDEIFSSRAELLYAGGGKREGQAIPAQERDRVFAALRELERSHGHS